ncbi:MAG: DUF3443 family protein [Burkholderiales bacterium]|nr:DUF3443 family protein [Burkholderiales bacterium]
MLFLREFLTVVLRGLLITFFAIILVACGGGSSSSSSSDSDQSSLPSVNLSANSISINVGAGTAKNVNTPYVSVTICQPGTNICKTVDNILLDTGSTGLRVLASTITSLQLTQVVVNYAPILECASFISGDAWGPVKLADVKMSAEVASSIPIQILADPSYSTIPSACGGSQNTQISTTLKTNGILGIGLFINDDQSYFNCVPTALNNCRISLSLAPNLQVQNPVAAFPVNNNGVIIKLPSVSATGAKLVTGSLTFGIDTQTNNSSVGSYVIPTNSSGLFTTIFNNTTFNSSFIDSGSNGLYFPSGSLSSVLVNCSSFTLSGFYCPAVTQSYMASLTLKNNVLSNVSFSAANAKTLVANGNYAYNNITGQIGGNLFDWGLPFFFGKSVFIGITGRTSSAGIGPYYAYTN